MLRPLSLTSLDQTCEGSRLIFDLWLSGLFRSLNSIFASVSFTFSLWSLATDLHASSPSLSVIKTSLFHWTYTGICYIWIRRHQLAWFALPLSLFGTFILTSKSFSPSLSVTLYFGPPELGFWYFTLAWITYLYVGIISSRRIFFERAHCFSAPSAESVNSNATVHCFDYKMIRNISRNSIKAFQTVI